MGVDEVNPQTIRHARELLGLTQKELAERVGGGCSQARIARIESGSAGPGKYRREIASQLGLDESTPLLRQERGVGDRGPAKERDLVIDNQGKVWW